jgi:hypothetical protein
LPVTKLSTEDKDVDSVQLWASQHTQLQEDGEGDEVHLLGMSVWREVYWNGGAMSAMATVVLGFFYGWGACRVGRARREGGVVAQREDKEEALQGRG